MFYAIAYWSYSPTSDNNDSTMPPETNIHVASHTEGQSKTRVSGVDNPVYDDEISTAAI